MYVVRVMKILYGIYIVFIGISIFFNLDKKIELKKRIFSTSFTILLILIINYTFNINEFSYLLEALTLYIYYLYLYKRNITVILLTSIYLLSFSLLKYIIIFIYSVMTFDLQVLKIMNTTRFFLFIMFLLIMLTIIVFIGNFFEKCRVNISSTTIKKQTIMVFIIGISVLLSEKVFDNIQITSKLLYRVNISTLIIAINLAIVHFIMYKKYKEYKFDFKLKILERQLNYQKKYYEKVMDNYDEAKKAFHDMNNHIIVIKYFLENKDYNNMNEYIKSLSKKIVTNNDKNICKNKIINAICVEKSDICKSEEINISFDIVINKELNIDDLDLCIILGNLIDNAIEACEKINNKKIQKVIQVSSRVYLNQIYIKVINSKNNKLKKHNCKFLTSKKDKKNHGIGLENVKESVYKNDGEIEIKDSKNTFEVSLYMKC
ncbi:TPA: GHKL domain-containing protein [Clostridium perfringens]|nr:GHKL domain-containing protein [Clostridium perfringens]